MTLLIIAATISATLVVMAFALLRGTDSAADET